MKDLVKLTLASAVIAGSFATTVPQASAQGRHAHEQDRPVCYHNDVLPVLLVGAALGAVTGGVGSAVVLGSAYAVGGAAVGGAGGLLLATHDDRYCR